MDVLQIDNSVRNLPISNSKPDLHNISVNTKFGENPWTFTKVTIWKWKYWRGGGGGGGGGGYRRTTNVTP